MRGFNTQDEERKADPSSTLRGLGMTTLAGLKSESRSGVDAARTEYAENDGDDE